MSKRLGENGTKKETTSQKKNNVPMHSGYRQWSTRVWFPETLMVSWFISVMSQTSCHFQDCVRWRVWCHVALNEITLLVFFFHAHSQSVLWATIETFVWDVWSAFDTLLDYMQQILSWTVTFLQRAKGAFQSFRFLHSRPVKMLLSDTFLFFVFPVSIPALANEVEFWCINSFVICNASVTFK